MSELTSDPLANHGLRWTIGDKIQLRQSWEDGKSLREICLDLKRSPAGVLAMLVQLGILYVHDGNYYRRYNPPLMTFKEVAGLHEELQNASNQFLAANRRVSEGSTAVSSTSSPCGRRRGMRADLSLETVMQGAPEASDHRQTVGESDDLGPQAPASKAKRRQPI